MLIYSGMRAPHSGRYSFLGLRPDAHVTSDNFADLEQALAASGSYPLDRWFGYLGYELGNALETLPEGMPSHITMPNLWMIKYRLLMVFDHEMEKVAVWAKEASDLEYIPRPTQKRSGAPVVTSISSNMTKAEYLQHVETLLGAIKDGDLYQANLTRKFFGTVEQADAASLFSQLCARSPSPYSALFKFDSCYILSSSPEQFLTVLPDGSAVTRPIKGSAPRFVNSNDDERSRDALIGSEKNRAENLMIVDLMRNDLARSCEAGSVTVESLFDCTSYATIHHLSSTISGKKKENLSALDLIKNCFPPGSMTGTPKIKAMEYCARLEKNQRGIYSGALGWIGKEEADLSVVIRTLILRENKFEFQVGGAIVADSSPEEEWQETLTKARAVASILTLPMSTLEAL